MNETRRNQGIWSDNQLITVGFLALLVMLATGRWQAGLAMLVVGLLVAHFWQLGYVGQWLRSGRVLLSHWLEQQRSKQYESPDPYQIVLGKEIETGKNVIRDITSIGSLGCYSLTRFGKTRLFQVLLHQLVTRNRPEDLRVAIIDPFEFDYRIWQRIPHLLCPIARTEEEAIRLIYLVAEEMERRGKLFNAIPERYLCNSLGRYHALVEQLGIDLPRLPRIIILIDEMDYFSKKGSDLENMLIHLAKRGQKLGMYLWAATQRPTTDIMSGTIRAEFTGRLIGHMADSGDYYRVHAIPPEIYQRMTGDKGQFMFCAEGEWTILQALWLPDSVLEGWAARLSQGPVRDWNAIPRPIQERPARHPWRGTTAEKRVLVLDWLQGFTRRPTAAEFMGYFEVESSATATKWIDKCWHKYVQAIDESV